MNQAKKTLSALLKIIVLDQTIITITFPLITLIFFDPQSRLFAHDTSYAARSAWYGICVGLPNFINLFFAPLLSSLSDVVGRKKILLIEIFCAALFTLTVGVGVYIGSLALIFIGYVVRGAFCRSNPTALTIIGDTTPKEKKITYMGYLQFAISIGAATGPVLGGYFATRFFFSTMNFSLPYFIAAALALLNTLFVIIFIRETLQKSKRHAWEQINIAAIKRIFTHPDVLRISLILLLIQLSWSLYYQFTPPILKAMYGFTAGQLGLFMGMIAFWLAVATGAGIKLMQRFFTPQQILLVSCYFILAGLLITALALSQLVAVPTYVVWLGAIPVAAGDVIAYSCLTAFYSNAVLHEEQGKVMGVSFMVVGAVWASTGFIGGLLMGISPLLPLIIAPASIIVCLTLLHANFGRKLVLNYNN